MMTSVIHNPVDHPPYIGLGPGQFASIPPLLPYNPGEWVLLSDMVYTDLAGTLHVVPKYFVTDLASIPWVVEPVFRSIDSRLPGVLHDWTYCVRQAPRGTCDLLLAEALRVTGCDRVRERLIYAGVRAGGWYRYNQRTAGPQREDFAWEYMTLAETARYEASYLRTDTGGHGDR